MYKYPSDLKFFSKFIERQKKGGGFKRPKIELNTDNLNAEQRKGYEIVQRTLEGSGDQLLMYLHGVAGTGKTYLLACIRDLVVSKYTEDGVIVTAPTGVAAYNISGETLHSAFSLDLHLLNTTDQEVEIPPPKPVEYFDRDNVKEEKIDFDKEEELEVERESTRRLRTRLQAAHFIIIDEISMVGARTLAFVEKKMRQLLNSALPFAGKHVIISGDVGQLRPIYDTPLFAGPQKNGGQQELSGMKLYHMFQTVIILHQVVRQQGAEQARFREVLLNVRRGNFEEPDVNMLKSREMSRLDSDECKHLDSITHIFPFRSAVKYYNSLMLGRLGNRIHKIVLEPSGESGLTTSVEFAVGARVMLIRNLFVKAGLVNGAKGYIRDIVYNEGQTIPSVPLFVMVRFDEYCGEYPEGMDALPIPSMPMSWEIPGDRGWVKAALPLVLAYASTIHKTQGLTVDKIAVDFRQSTFVDHTMIFVAISRARRLNDIVFLSDFSKSFVKHLRSSKKNNIISNEDARLRLLAKNVSNAKNIE